MFQMFGERYRALLAECGENETLIMEYHTAAGERLLLEQVAYPPDTDMLVIQGHDAQGNVYQILAKARAVQMLFRFVPLDPGEARKPVGFRVEE
jgi:hypothetical protein